MGKNIYVFFSALGYDHVIYKVLKVRNVILKAVYVGKLVALHLTVGKTVTAVVVGKDVIARVHKIPDELGIFFTVFGKAVNDDDASYGVLNEIVSVRQAYSVKGGRKALINVCGKDIFHLCYTGSELIFADNGGFYRGIKHFNISVKGYFTNIMRKGGDNNGNR